jgi:hypothetical protein
MERPMWVDTFVVVGLAATACVAFALTWPLWRHLANVSPWAVVICIALAAIILDFRAELINGGAFRYLGTVVVIMAVFALSDRTLKGGRWFYSLAALLCIYAGAGTLVGRVYRHTPDGAFPFALPLAICLVGWLRDPGDAGLRLGLKMVSFFGSVFTLLAALQRLEVLSVASLSVFNHEKAFINVLALACAIAARSPILTGFAVAASAWVFTLYPAATYAVAAAVMMLTYALVKWRPGRTARGVIVAVGTPAALWVTIHFEDLMSWFNGYFIYVGKIDNSAVRSGFYSQALMKIERHPWFSEWFTGNLTIVTDLSGRQNIVLPVHNDYLGLALGGGLVATGLLIVIFALLNGLALEAAHYCSAERKRAITALLGAVNVAAVTSFANPVFMNPASSTAVWAIAAAVAGLSIGALRQRRFAEPMQGDNTDIADVAPCGSHAPN